MVYSIVKARKDLSNQVPIGSVGTVIMIYHSPTLAYEVEFVDELGNTLNILTVDYK